MTQGTRASDQLSYPTDDEALLDIKLSAPPLRAGLVTRAALIDAARARDASVVGVTAPAGYGKSTLLAEWARREERRVGWVSLARLDDDPVLLLHLLASAYERAVPEQAGLAAATAAAIAGGADVRRGAAVVASAMARPAAAYALLVDDLHHVRSPGCDRVLDVLLPAVPRGSQVVVASRGEPPHLAGLRAVGDAVEITERDLALGSGAAAQVLAAAGLPVTPEQAVDVTARVEGWPVGLNLAALVAREVRCPPGELSGADRYVADYLRREVLGPLDPGVQRFLRETAVLDRLHGPLCEAVVEDPRAPEMLLALEASHSFLVLLDRRREWYRYHRLFREFLLDELRRTEPGMTEELHLRAAGWFQAHAAPVQTVEHLLGAGELHRCAVLVAEIGPRVCGEGGAGTVQRWLTRLGDPVVAAHPPLAVVAGRTAAFLGDPVEAGRWAALADEVAPAPAPTEADRRFETARSTLRALLGADGPARMLADAEAAAGPEADPGPWQPLALSARGEALLLAGEPGRALAAFAEATAAGHAAPDLEVVALAEAETAMVDIDAGRWERAAGHVDHALGIVEQRRAGDDVLALLVRAAGARLAIHRSDLAEADRQIARAMRARSAATYALPWLATRGRLHLAKACWARGDRAGAGVLLREIDEVLVRRPDLGTLGDQVAELREATATADGTAPAPEVPLTPAELRLLPYLQTHLRMADIAERLHLSRNTVASEVSAIYRKLGVCSRGEAVHQAQVVGLLAP
ncbi:helix-turn-helix transcriptional regulator [Nocardioides marmotae]|uniref:helix-turn-helix transcriptional regulator n=1 Tax=Nocardioides marmotae TaxID=2663857 RepID=UPI0012B5E959|nr:LuxR family transcriptional regulator [Nocardioides marmotae]MBC9733983.1 LuxR family transcriptional regulator [Nocardioides marmotae]MTB85086.1 LuxR family transcriptional regulator [Nocardioides marmotae]